MYPVLFNIGKYPVHSYYVLWTFALSLALVWTRERAEKKFGADPVVLQYILLWSFISMLAGARIGGYFDNWSVYAEEPMRILKFWEGGMSSTPAFLAAGLTGIILCRKKLLPVRYLAEAASLPAAATVAIGRWGCFLNGCCYGRVTNLPWGVHFSGDIAGVLRHPTQIYYSVLSTLILLVLFQVERRMESGGRRHGGGTVLWPLFMILYGAERFLIDFLREGDRIMGLRTGQILGAGALIAGVVWLAASLGDRSRAS